MARSKALVEKRWFCVVLIADGEPDTELGAGALGCHMFYLVTLGKWPHISRSQYLHG